MFSDIAHVRSSLKARLAPLLPDTWTIEANLVQPPAAYLSPRLTFEFTRFESTVNGEALATGYVGAAVDLILGSPQTKDGAGEDDVDTIALALIRAIDRQDDIFWSSADKERLADGQWAWRIHTIALTEHIETS